MCTKIFKNLTLAVLFLGLAGVFSFAGSALAVSPDDYGLHEGDLIRATGDNDIFIVNEFGYKRLFLNPTIFEMYGHLGGWADVKTVSPDVRDAFETSPYYRADGDEKVYRLEVSGEDTGTLHWVNVSQAEFLANASVNSIFTINGLESAWYSKGADFTFDTPTGNLAVSLSDGNPVAQTIPSNGVNVEFLRFDTEVALDDLTFEHRGLGNKSEFESLTVWVNGFEVADRTFDSGGEAKFRNLDIDAGSIVSVKADMDGNAGNEHYIVLTSTDKDVSGLPLVGNVMRLAGDITEAIELTSSSVDEDEVVMGENDVQLADFKLKVPTDNSDVTVRSIQLLNIGDDIVSNLKMVVDGKTYGGIINSDDQILFDDLDIVIEEKKSEDFEVYGDIDEDADKGDTVTLEIENIDAVDINGFGVKVGGDLDSGTVEVIGSGSFEVVKDTDVETQVFLFGDTDKTILGFSIEPTGENFNLIDVVVSGLNDEVIKEIHLYSGGENIVSTDVDGNIATLSLDYTVDEDTDFTVKADFYKLSELDGDTIVKADFLPVLDGIAATGVNSDVDVPLVGVTEGFTGEKMYVYAATVEIVRTDGDWGTYPVLENGWEQDVLTFSIKAIGNDVTLAKGSSSIEFAMRQNGLISTSGYETIHHIAITHEIVVIDVEGWYETIHHPDVEAVEAVVGHEAHCVENASILTQEECEATPTNGTWMFAVDAVEAVEAVDAWDEVIYHPPVTHTVTVVDVPAWDETVEYPAVYATASYELKLSNGDVVAEGEIKNGDNTLTLTFLEDVDIAKNGTEDFVFTVDFANYNDKGSYFSLELKDVDDAIVWQTEANDEALYTIKSVEDTIVDLPLKSARFAN